MVLKNLNNINNEEFNKFIEECEANIIAAPENFASSVMSKIAKINETTAIKSVKAIPFISRKMRAAICFCSAAAIIAMTYFGVNDTISQFLSEAVSPEKIHKISEFLNQIIIFKLN